MSTLSASSSPWRMMSAPKRPKSPVDQTPCCRSVIALKSGVAVLTSPSCVPLSPGGESHVYGYAASDALTLVRSVALGQPLLRHAQRSRCLGGQPRASGAPCRRRSHDARHPMEIRRRLPAALGVGTEDHLLNLAGGFAPTKLGASH